MTPSRKTEILLAIDETRPDDTVENLSNGDILELVDALEDAEARIAELQEKLAPKPHLVDRPFQRSA